MSNERDRTRVTHMLEACEEAIGFADSVTLNQLREDRKLALALVKCIEIVGEAAARTSKPTRNEIDGVPWQDVIGMRNHLIHGYADVDLAIVLATVQRDLPPMVEALRRWLNA